MRFGKSLEKAQYGPWKEHYLDYNKLKTLLRESESDKPWTDEDEQQFVEELINVQLEKVNSFQTNTYKSLTDKTNQCESKLQELVSKDGEENKADKSKLTAILKELDGIREEITRLERFSRINYTGALKAAKKHDRRRGTNYKVRPLLQVRLTALPSNSEDYSPLLYRLSAMYAFIRPQLEENSERAMSNTDPRTRSTVYTSYKFFVHLDNLLELKTSILRHLPVLVYTPTSTKAVDAVQKDPVLTSLYFDNRNFSLYTGKVDKGKGASSLRFRWYGQLRDQETPELIVEKKTLGEGDDSEEVRFTIKEKYILPFLKGEYKMEKQIAKLKQRNGNDSVEAQNLEKTVEEIQEFIKNDELQPILRASYTRTAFQIPGDDRVRISLDTNMAFVREDCLDTDRPVRNPDTWHRTDIDDKGMEYPFSEIRKGEISKFPYALLEIKVREGSKRKHPVWVDDIMSSHLIREAPRFSKFIHGVATLFEDYINTLPFWMSLLETDIRKDPEEAFEEEQQKKLKQAEDELAVGSFLGSLSKSPQYASKGSPANKKSFGGKSPATKILSPVTKAQEEETDPVAPIQRPVSKLQSLFPAFSSSKYAQAKRDRVQLPPGVKVPEYWIKDVGVVKVEPKVWLANQRTFIKWAHVTILLSTLSLSLYNTAGLSSVVAEGLAIVYTAIAIFAGAWGYGLYVTRSRVIRQRSGEDLDNVLGPVIVCVALAVALCLNFGLRFHSLKGSNELLQTLHLAS